MVQLPLLGLEVCQEKDGKPVTSMLAKMSPGCLPRQILREEEEGKIQPRKSDQKSPTLIFPRKYSFLEKKLHWLPWQVLLFSTLKNF